MLRTFQMPLVHVNCFQKVQGIFSECQTVQIHIRMNVLVSNCLKRLSLDKNLVTRT